MADLEFFPLTPERWPDLEALFGDRGATGGCWCMWWRIKRSKFDKQKGDGNKQAFKAIVTAGDQIPGLLAYRYGHPVCWCAVAPRDQFPVLNRSRTLKPVDDRPVWSINCFFIHKSCRNQGLTVQLLQAAINYVRRQGGKVLEGYPVEPKKDTMPVVFAWTGFASAFRQCGFVEIARRSETRPIMRYSIH